MRTRFSVKQRGGGFSLDLSHNRSLAKHRALIEWALPWSGFAEVVLLRTGRFASHANLVAQDMCVDKTHHFPPLHEAATIRGCRATGVCSTLSIYGNVARQFLAEWAIASEGAEPKVHSSTSPAHPRALRASRRVVMAPSWRQAPHWTRLNLPSER